MVTQTGETSIRLIGWRKWLRRLHPVLNGMGMVLVFSQPGWSHSAIATVTHRFSIEANYGSGEPMAVAQVVVYSPDNPNVPWATGETDQQGQFEFIPDTTGNWEVVIRQAGHGTTVNVPVGATMLAASSETATHPPLMSTSSPLQRWASAGAGLWGLVGTVLFFSRGKQSP